MICISIPRGYHFWREPGNCRSQRVIETFMLRELFTKRTTCTIKVAVASITGETSRSFVNRLLNADTEFVRIITLLEQSLYSHSKLNENRN
ncbi:hypothetical protein BDV19DRAFT_369046 [Aspergillus venezuelensis]